MTAYCSNCGNPTPSTETHHVNQQKGDNDPDNLTPRCTRCHHDIAHDNPKRTDNYSTEQYGPRSPDTGPPDAR